MKVKMDILWKYFSFLAYQRSVQLLYDTLDINSSFNSFYSQTVLAL